MIEYVKKHCDVFHFWAPKRGWGKWGLFYSGTSRIKQRHEVYFEGENEIHRYIIETQKGNLTSLTKVGKYQSEWCVKPFIQNEEDIERFFAIPSEPLRPDLSPFFAEEKKLGDKVAMSIVVTDPVGTIAPLFSRIDFILKIFKENKVVTEMMDTIYERCFAHLEYLLAKGARPVFWISGPEYVAPPLFHPSYFREFAAKYDRKLIRLAHQYNMPVIIHCHGSVNALLETFASIGTDGLHPIEPPPMGDTPLSEAKRKIGDRVCLVGNIQIGDILVSTREEMDQKVKQAICEGGPCGLILDTSASPYWTPLPEGALNNFIQYIQSGIKYGRSVK